MRHFPWLFLVVAILLVGCATSRTEDSASTPEQVKENAVAPDSPGGLIPLGTIRVAVMDLVSPPRLVELTGRFQAAAQERPEWWLEYSKANARPGQPLPYHPNMGVTAAEYTEMLSLFGQVRFAPKNEVELTVRSEGNGRVLLDGGGDLPELTGILIDFAKNRVRTPFGTTTTTKRIEANDAQKATGPWTGVSWQHEDVNKTGTNGTVINLSLGRLQETGRGILYYDVKRVVNGAMQNRVSRVITYELTRR